MSAIEYRCPFCDLRVAADISADNVVTLQHEPPACGAFQKMDAMAFLEECRRLSSGGVN
jgi:hypothetical protein